MPIPASKLRRILRRKLGFEELPKKKHEGYAVVIGGKIVARTYMSRSRGDITDELLNWMAKELNVRLRDFKRAIYCTIEPDAFLKLILKAPR